MSPSGGKTFVLVHGAWHGGWCWLQVADLLRSRGHIVSTPTQTGLGERSHLLNENVDFETFVQDIVHHLEFERLTNVVLVGHSFGGSVTTVVVDRLAERIDRVIFLDASLAEDGCSTMEQSSPTYAQEQFKLAHDTSRGLTIPCPPPERFGVFSAEHSNLLKNRLTPHPIKTYLSKMQLDGPIGGGRPCDFILCTDPLFDEIERGVSLARDAGWPFHELRTGHDAMITAPAATADLFERIALQNREA